VLEPDSPGGTYFTVPIAEIETLEVCRGDSGATAGGMVGGLSSVVSFLLGQGIGRLLAGRPSRFPLPRSRGAPAPATSHDPCGPSRASPSFSGASHETGDPNER